MPSKRFNRREVQASMAAFDALTASERRALASAAFEWEPAEVQAYMKRWRVSFKTALRQMDSMRRRREDGKG